ncbi:MAG: TonB-dependent receptor [Acidobacteriales bacterium]|nr:TonB-dependent receptor [Terriglobales bacterium]
MVVDLGAGSGPSVGGQRPRNNNFTVEGVDNNDKGVTGPLTYVPNDAVANFSILQNQYSPEFGHSTGGQFNTVIMSGTNSFHGRLYEYFQNRNLNAVDTSLANQGIRTNPRFDNNRFGGQVGGPIIKDKAFFFVNYERNPVGQAASPGSPIYAPTEAGYATILGLEGVSASNVNGLKQYMTAATACDPDADPDDACEPVTVNGVRIDHGVFPVVAPNWINFYSLTTSGDLNISSKDQLRVRYLYNSAPFIDTGQAGTTLPVFFTIVPIKYHLATLAEYHQFSPTLSNELRLGYNRTGNNFAVPNLKFENLDAFPNLTIDELGLNLGPDPNAPQYATQNTYQLVDNMTWIKGNHSLKFGIEGRKSISPQLFIQRARGDYEWASLEGFALDLAPEFGERSVGSVGYSGDLWALYWFATDTWKIRPNLSLNLGIRYEYTKVPFGWTQQSLNSIASEPGLISFDAPKAPKDGWMPRIGFNYSPGTSGNTSIRGGFGLGYDILYDNIGTLSRPPQIGSTKDCPDHPDCHPTGFLANGGLLPGGGTGITEYPKDVARSLTSSYLPPNVKYPYSIQWNFGVQHIFAKNYTAEVRYVGTRGVHLNVQNRINIQNKVTPTEFLPTYFGDPSQTEIDALTTTLSQIRAKSSLVPAYAAAGFTNPIVGFVPWGDSVYHGLQTQVTRRLSNGLQFMGSYTWSKNIDNSTADFFSTIVTPRRPQDFRNLAAERSDSALDHRHRFTMQLIYDLPFFRNDSNWLLKNVVGNWEFAPIYTYETGEWGTLQSGVDSNLNGDSAGDRPVFNAGGQRNVGTDAHPLCNSAIGNQSLCTNTNTGARPFIVAYGANNPDAQYAVARAGALSNVGRNTVRLPYINNWDMTFLKRISITERFRVEGAFQLLNLFNHPQYIAGSLNQITSIGRTQPSERNYLIPSAGNFLDAKNSWPSNARVTQLYVKFIF